MSTTIKGSCSLGTTGIYALKLHAKGKKHQATVIAKKSTLPLALDKLNETHTAINENKNLTKNLTSQVSKENQNIRNSKTFSDFFIKEQTLKAEII